MSGHIKAVTSRSPFRQALATAILLSVPINLTPPSTSFE